MKRWALLLAVLAACEDPKTPVPAPVPPAPIPGPAPAARTGPDRIQVQHVLISFKGATQKPDVTRSQEDARKLAQNVFERAMRNEDFDALVRLFSDDSIDGKYVMVNDGVQPENAEEFTRGGMVKAFGDVAFGLQVGQIGIAEYDPQRSPFGWHIVKRLK